MRIPNIMPEGFVALAQKLYRKAGKKSVKGWHAALSKASQEMKAIHQRSWGDPVESGKIVRGARGAKDYPLTRYIGGEIWDSTADSRAEREAGITEQARRKTEKKVAKETAKTEKKVAKETAKTEKKVAKKTAKTEKKVAKKTAKTAQAEKGNPPRFRTRGVSDYVVANAPGVCDYMVANAPDPRVVYWLNFAAFGGANFALANTGGEKWLKRMVISKVLNAQSDIATVEKKKAKLHMVNLLCLASDVLLGGGATSLGFFGGKMARGDGSGMRGNIDPRAIMWSGLVSTAVKAIFSGYAYSQDFKADLAPAHAIFGKLVTLGYKDADIIKMLPATMQGDYAVWKATPKSAPQSPATAPAAPAVLATAPVTVPAVLAANRYYVGEKAEYTWVPDSAQFGSEETGRYVKTADLPSSGEASQKSNVWDWLGLDGYSTGGDGNGLGSYMTAGDLGQYNVAANPSRRHVRAPKQVFSGSRGIADLAKTMGYHMPI